MLENCGAVFNPNEAESEYSPDIIAVLTCSITSAADNKTRKILRRVRRENPSSLILACGCWAQTVSSDEAESIGVDILIGNRLKGSTLESIDRWFESKGYFLERRAEVSGNKLWDELSVDRPRMHTRAFIKIQDGCNRACSYCAVPSLRGAEVSRDPDKICEEIQSVIASGCAEIILTGIHLGGYSCCGTSLADLVRKISSIEGLRRLRFGSLEPFAVTDELLLALADSEVFCRHLHLPVQSGDDSILLSMRRGYTSKEFARITGMTKSILGDDAHISTDLIVGFPGESERAFSNSLSLLSDLGLGRVHVFPYSERRNTAAAVMDGAVGRGEIKERTSRAIGLSARLLSDYAKCWLNRTDSVLIESSEDGLASGWSEHYLKVYTADLKSTKKDVSGNVLEVCPEREVRGILLGRGVDDRYVLSSSEDQI
jgi:threonylcarbamoyladenosine tRNA methylthiotransferase MtaB